MPTLNGPVLENDFEVPGNFRYRRAEATRGGYRPVVDDLVDAELARLDELLGSKVVADEEALKEIISLPLTPRRADQVGVGRWENGSLCDKLRDLRPGEGEDTIGEVATRKAPAADLRYEFADLLASREATLTLEQRTVLGYKRIRDLILARGIYLHEFTSAKALLNFALRDKDGVPEVVDYAVVSAARQHVDRQQMRVPKIEDDDSAVVRRLEAAHLLFSADTFADRVVEIVTDVVTGAEYEKFIDAANIPVADLPNNLRPRLINYLRHSPVKITEENAPFMVPYFLVKAADAGPAVADSTVPSFGGGVDDPFKVRFFTELANDLQVSTAAVKCASQLYYVMTLGDELGVFEAVRYFTHHYLFRQGFAVEDKVLRRDLENYVFSEQFPGLDTVDGEHRLMRCTREGERRAFYRQVFDHGDERVPGDAPANSDFGRLWKILMLESTRYLERVQDAPHPNNVSPQNVMQAVEDLQYNLSTSCVGMATVMTPLMYAELDFVVDRILNHQEVRRHLVPAGGSWWKVIEKLASDRNRRVRASVLNNKARLGYQLIRQVAEYSTTKFEQPSVFNRFISDVEAFITTQSIIQEEAVDDGDDAVGRDGRMSASPFPGMPPIPGMPDGIPGMRWGQEDDAGYPREPVGARTEGNGGGGNSSSSGDEWDF